MKRILCVLLLGVLLPACATLRRDGDDNADRSRLWAGAHAALARDSVPVAAALFQRLAAEHPRTDEGREARFYLGVLHLEPRYAEFSPARSAEHFNIYLSLDSAQDVRVYREPAARSLLRLAQQLQLPCEDRIAALRGAPTVIERERRVPGAPTPAPTNGVSAAEAERLRGIIGDRDAEIARLREELARIRNTLVPRRNPPR